MKYVLTILGGMAAAALIFFGAGKVSLNGENAQEVGQVPHNGILSLITEPKDGIAPVLALIKIASTSVDLVMYEFADNQVEQALIAAKDRGVAVRVLLSQGYYGETSSVNGQAYDFLKSQGIAVAWTPAKFALTHEKALVIDGQAAMIMTFNLMPEYYATSRDFGIVDQDAKDVQAIEETFNADWKGSEIVPSSADDLVWSPGSENETVSLINAATGTLDIYNEEMADDRVTSALEAAAHRGVAVRILMTYASEWKSVFGELAGAGAQIKTYSSKAPVYVHAKMILASGAEAFVGSQNFSETSQEENRELGILITESPIIESLSSTFDSDWKNAAPF